MLDEIAHFIDYYAAHKREIKRTYSSDEEGSIARNIAKMFRKNMNKKTDSDYQNRTVECFARAFEQYFNPNLHTESNHCKKEVFEQQVIPLIEEFLKNFMEIVSSIKIEEKCFERPRETISVAASNPTQHTKTTVNLTKPVQTTLFENYI